MSATAAIGKRVESGALAMWPWMRTWSPRCTWFFTGPAESLTWCLPIGSALAEAADKVRQPRRMARTVAAIRNVVLLMS